MTTTQTFSSSPLQIAQAFLAQIIFIFRFLFGSLGLIVGSVLVGRQEVLLIAIIGAISFLAFISVLLTEPVRLAFRLTWNPELNFRLKYCDESITQEVDGYPSVSILRTEVEKIFETANGLVIQSSLPKRSIVVPSVINDYESLKNLLKPWGIVFEGKAHRAKMHKQILSRPVALLRLLIYIPVAVLLVWQAGQFATLLSPVVIGLVLSEVLHVVFVLRIRRKMNVV